MKLTTPVKIPSTSVELDHKFGVLNLGSCFAENIGNKLKKAKFSCLLNPFGIVYNPISISHIIHRIFNRKLVSQNELLSCQDYFCHPLFHSSFNAIDAKVTEGKMNDKIKSSNDFILTSLDLLIISFGTAFVWKLEGADKVVNNCHKLPGSMFTKHLLEMSDILQNMGDSIELLREKHPSLRVILTVSPVRHTKEGLINNQRSKSLLIQSCHHLADADEKIEYFPSYEMMVDELRDYRFYENDLIHPTPTAIDLIWKRFKDSYVSNESREIIDQLGKFHKMLEHRPFLKESEGFANHLHQCSIKLEQLKSIYPKLSFDKEEKHLYWLRDNS